MILEAKNALGRVPGLNENLLDIQKNYFDKGDMFWIALSDNDRVIGSVGYNSIANSDDVALHRLFVKYNLKHQGIGTALLKTVEELLKAIGKKTQLLFLSLLRKGSMDIVFMLLLNKTMGISGIVWATPFADWIALVISTVLIVPYLKRLNH